MTPREKELYNALQYAYEFMCGSSSDKAQEDCIKYLGSVLERYRDK